MNKGENQMKKNRKEWEMKELMINMVCQNS